MQEIDIGIMDPADVADRLCGEPGFAFLDSADRSGANGRRSFIGVRPFARFAVENGVATWNDAPLPGAPLAELRAALARYRLDETDDGGFPFRGGAIGFAAYEFGRRLEERLAEPARRDTGEEMSFFFYDVVFAFHHQSRRCRLFSSGLPEPEGRRRAARAGERADEVLALLRTGRAERPASAAPPPVGLWTASATPESFAENVARVQSYIRAGDIYQANIAQRFEAPLPPGFDPYAFYRELRRTNPAPFAGFLRFEDRAIASSSPERFLRCRNGEAEARPIKGTARRSADPAEDAALAAALLASEKDRAENVMIVDLLRNDLSRVCRPGSVEVPVLCGLESYASVHHLTSVVRGRLRDGFDAIDLFAAAFPCGSITGAPKLRAMDIITEIEGMSRGVYCGAIGYIGFDGAMDLNVAIRTVTLTPTRATFHAGGGITLLSEPEGEYRETLLKAERIFAAFGSEPPCSS